MIPITRAPGLTDIETRRLRYEHLRAVYAKLYGDLQLVRTELNTLEAEMLELGELEEGDIA